MGFLLNRVFQRYHISIVSLMLKDMYAKTWNDLIFSSPKYATLMIFITTFVLENYLIQLPEPLYIQLIQIFCLENVRFTTKRQRRRFSLPFKCHFVHNERNLNISNRFITRPTLSNSGNYLFVISSVLETLCMFIKIINKVSYSLYKT